MLEPDVNMPAEAAEGEHDVHEEKKPKFIVDSKGKKWPLKPVLLRYGGFTYFGVKGAQGGSLQYMFPFFLREVYPEIVAEIEAREGSFDPAITKNDPTKIPRRRPEPKFPEVPVDRDYTLKKFMEFGSAEPVHGEDEKAGHQIAKKLEIVAINDKDWYDQ